MARKIMVVDKGAEIKGWGTQVMNILLTIFLIALVFGAILIASSLTSGTIQTTQNQYATQSSATTNSPGANDMNSLNTGTLTLQLGATSYITSSNPLTITVTGNSLTKGSITAPGKNALAGIANSITFTYTSPNTANQIVANTANLYNITSITETGLLQGDSGVAITAWESYTPFTTNAGNVAQPQPVGGTGGVNVIVATATFTVGNLGIGTSTSSAWNVFGTLTGYLVTLSNFTGIIILLAIIVVVIGVLYYFFGKKEDSLTFGGGV